MICVRLEGGLGNQLFQYAAGRALSLRHGSSLLIDTGKLGRQNGTVTTRHLELDHFRHVGRIATPQQSNHLPWLRRIAPISHWLSPWRTTVERGLGYNEAFSRLPDGTYLVGYWQSPRYFEEIAERLVEELQPARPLSAASQAVIGRMDGSCVALHVRRGDYVSLASAASLHGTLGLQYYRAALSHISQRLGGAGRYFVFSDDIAWCRAQLPLNPEDTVYVDHNGGADTWQDLILMSHCRHHVIANSSFSWWGAWLGDQRHGKQLRMVIAPRQWFAGQPQQDLRDRFPAHWTVLQ